MEYTNLDLLEESQQMYEDIGILSDPIALEQTLKQQYLNSRGTQPAQQDDGPDDDCYSDEESESVIQINDAEQSQGINWPSQESASKQQA